MDFENKVCVVTGGANGIGLSIIKEFAKKGAKVAFIDLDKTAGEKLLKSLNKSGPECLFFCGDIAEKAVIDSFAEEVIKTFGKVDYLINNACLSKKGIITGCDYEDFNYVLKVGVTAPYMLSKLFLNFFNKEGAIVNISSTRAFMSQPDTESYSAAKGGISALTHALAISLAGRVRVNSVSPGWINVSSCDNQAEFDDLSHADKIQQPVGRIGKPFDIVNAVMFLCDESNGFINGENITVDGGMTKQMVYHGEYGWTRGDIS